MGLCVGDMHGGQEMGDMVIFLKTGAVLQRGWSRSRNKWELPFNFQRRNFTDIKGALSDLRQFLVTGSPLKL